MTMLENEVAADNQRRMYDKLSKSPADQVMEVVGDFVQPLSAVLRIRDRILDLGVPTLEENLDYLGEAVENAISRIERNQKDQYEELKRRLESIEFQNALSEAVLQTQRTSQKVRLRRLALILSNGVAVDDLNPEGLDDMFRAAVELKEADIILLNKLYGSQAGMVDRVQKGIDRNWESQIQTVWKEFIDSGNLDPRRHLEYRSSFSRLESFGLIQKLDFRSYKGVGTEMYALLSEGKKFCERANEVNWADSID